MILAALSDYFDLNRLMGMLPNYSEHGKEIDHMLNFCHWFMLILFVGWGSFFLYTIWRFRKSRPPQPLKLTKSLKLIFSLYVKTL